MCKCEGSVKKPLRVAIEIDFNYIVPHPPEKVFSYLSTFENHAQFLPLTTSEQITEGPVQIGTQFRHVSNMLGMRELKFETRAQQRNEKTIQQFKDDWATIEKK